MNQPPPRRPQMSLRFMLLVNIIFCVIAGALYWASRVPAISDELDMMMGGRGGDGGTTGRGTHVIFVMFTYTAPLLLAGVLSSLLGLWRLFTRPR